MTPLWAWRTASPLFPIRHLPQNAKYCDSWAIKPGNWRDCRSLKISCLPCYDCPDSPGIWARTLGIPHIQERTFQCSPLKIFPATQIPWPSTQVPQARTRKNTCGQKPNWDGNTDQHRHVVAKRSVKHPIQKRTRVFLLETQNGIVQDELALWRIAAVVSKKNLRLTTCPKSTLRHSSGVATCWGLLTSGLIMLRWHLRSSSWGSALGWELPFFCLHTCVQHILPHFFWARWKAKTTAAVVFVFHLVQGALTGGGLELGQRRRHSRRILPDFFPKLRWTIPSEALSCRHLGSFAGSPSSLARSLWVFASISSGAGGTWQGMAWPKATAGPAPCTQQRHRLSWRWCQTGRPIRPGLQHPGTHCCSHSTFSSLVRNGQEAQLLPSTSVTTTT